MIDRTEQVWAGVKADGISCTGIYLVLSSIRNRDDSPFIDHAVIFSHTDENILRGTLFENVESPWEDDPFMRRLL